MEQLRGDIPAFTDPERLLTAQQQIMEILARPEPPEAITADLLATMGRSMGWDAGLLWRRDKKEQRLRCGCLWRSKEMGLPDRDLSSQEPTLGRGLPGAVWERNEPLWLPDLGSETLTLDLRQGAWEGFRSAAAVPVRGSSGRVLGV